jgi:hypothetical protein
MTRTTPEQIIAHVDLLHAVDRLLTQAEIVREKREALDRLLSNGATDQRRPATSSKTEGHHDE